VLNTTHRFHGSPARGVPCISKNLLMQRLVVFERAGIPLLRRRQQGLDHSAIQGEVEPDHAPFQRR